MEKRGIFQNSRGTLRGGPQCGWGWGWEAALRTNKKKRMSNRGGSDEREMKVTSSKPRKIRVAEEDNEGRQEKRTSVWRCLGPGAPAAAPWLCQRGAAACPKHPQRETVRSGDEARHSQTSGLAEIRLWPSSSSLSLTC